jgi:hypothetical protein
MVTETVLGGGDFDAALAHSSQVHVDRPAHVRDRLCCGVGECDAAGQVGAPDA